MITLDELIFNIIFFSIFGFVITFIQIAFLTFILKQKNKEVNKKNIITFVIIKIILYVIIIYNSNQLVVFLDFWSVMFMAFFCKTKNSEKNSSASEHVSKFNCPVCNYTNTTNDHYCENCGNVINVNYQNKDKQIPDDKNKCPNCGSLIDKSESICEFCGTKMN